VEAQRAEGIDAQLGVVERRTSDRFVLRMPSPSGLLRRIRNKALRELETCLLGSFPSTNPIFRSLNLGSRVDIRWINDSDFDLIHLHWVGHDTLSIGDIGRIEKPLFWTMHDSWPACGTEHHPNPLYQDSRYRDGYRRGSSIGSRRFDLDRLAYVLKNRLWVSQFFNFVAPSSWELGILKSSALFRDREKWRVTVIPNIVDNQVFVPKDKAAVREAIGLPSRAIVIGFGSAYAVGADANPKGGHLLLDALKSFARREGERAGMILLLVFGPVQRDFIETAGFTVFSSGYIDNEQILNLLYNCCDVFVCPSMVESFGLTALEAGAAGIPVAAFKTSGVLDIVEQQKNGYLATAFDTEDLARGIGWCLANAESAGKAARERAERDFAPTDIVRMHRQYYSSE